MKKNMVLMFSLFILCAAVGAQTVDLGKHIFFNGEGPINAAVDARMAERTPDAPYLMFMLFITADKGVRADIGRDDITLVYKDQEYKMPSVRELRAGYPSVIRDLEMYWRLGLENLSVAEMRLYRFKSTGDFFPPEEKAVLPANTASVANDQGYQTNIYFKNLGFKTGDELVFKVRDGRHPEIKTEVKVVL